MTEPTKDIAASHFGEEIERLIDRFRMEYDISYAALVGCLMMQAHSMMREAYGDDDDD